MLAFRLENIADGQFIAGIDAEDTLQLKNIAKSAEFQAAVKQMGCDVAQTRTFSVSVCLETGAG